MLEGAYQEMGGLCEGGGRGFGWLYWRRRARACLIVEGGRMIKNIPPSVVVLELHLCW